MILENLLRANLGVGSEITEESTALELLSRGQEAQPVNDRNYLQHLGREAEKAMTPITKPLQEAEAIGAAQPMPSLGQGVLAVLGLSQAPAEAFHQNYYGDLKRQEMADKGFDASFQDAEGDEEASRMGMGLELAVGLGTTAAKLSRLKPQPSTTQMWMAGWNTSPDQLKVGGRLKDQFMKELDEAYDNLPERLLINPATGQEEWYKPNKWKWISTSEDETARALRTKYQAVDTEVGTFGIRTGKEGKPELKFWYTDNPTNLVSKDGIPILAREGINGKSTKRLGDIYKDEGLFKAYPELRNMKIHFDKDHKTLGTYHPSTKSITLKAKQPPSQRYNTLMHEIQHHIQEVEGWPKGGAMLKPNVAQERIQEIGQALNPFADLKRLDSEVLIDAFNWRMRELDYFRLYGEVEARATGYAAAQNYIRMIDNLDIGDMGKAHYNLQIENLQSLIDGQTAIAEELKRRGSKHYNQFNIGQALFESYAQSKELLEKNRVLQSIQND